ncbi:MAG: hypothetical protein LBN97_00675, partial [Oscillospiraceae bacterium]|nr:hypothetical protein [Oscillospiraceae bacterium]
MTSFREELSNELTAILSDGSLSKKLTGGLVEYKSRFHSNRVVPTRDTIEHTVRNWLNGTSKPNQRGELIAICFALGLSAGVADSFLRKFGDAGFHLREPQEAALFYCLKSGKTIEQSAEFIAGLDLSFNTIANTASYLRLNVPVTRSTAGLDTIQKVIREYWIGEMSIKRILERKEDVTRKSLLLLYIATGGESTYFDEPDNDSDVPLALYFENEMTPQESLENHSIAIDIMLKECGFASLDPRNPFDWLI